MTFKTITCALVAVQIFCMACSTKVYINDHTSVAGKRIAIGEIRLDAYASKNKQKVDTLCDCVASAMKNAMYPFFQQAGFAIVELPFTPKKLKGLDILNMVDSMKLDYVMTGIGIVEVMGKPGKEAY